jgi:hypothetical protein
MRPMNSTDTGTGPTDERGTSSGTNASIGQDLDPRIFSLLIARIEQLARELGRTEGRQTALEQQIARLEERMAALQRGPNPE